VNPQWPKSGVPYPHFQIDGAALELSKMRLHMHSLCQSMCSSHSDSGEWRHLVNAIETLLCASSTTLCLVIMAALRSRCGHHIFALWFLFLSIFFIHRLFSAVADWMSTMAYFHTWCGLSANLGCRSEMCCAWLAENTGRKTGQKFAIWIPWHNFVGLYVRNWGMYRQSEKIVKQHYPLHMFSQYGELRPISGVKWSE